jgi:hypothetical protein
VVIDRWTTLDEAIVAVRSARRVVNGSKLIAVAGSLEAASVDRFRDADIFIAMGRVSELRNEFGGRRFLIPERVAELAEALKNSEH